MATKEGNGKPMKKYSRKALKAAPQQVASYSTRKKYAGVMESFSPETDALVDQMLNPEDCNNITRWPCTYGLSSVYKCKTVLNAKFDSEGRSAVAATPNIKDCLFATWGAESSVPVLAYAGVTNVNTNPYSFQSVTLDSLGEIVAWSAPIISSNGQCLTPFPSATNNALLYPIGFAAAGGGNGNIVLSLRFAGALTNQARVSLLTYDANKVFTGVVSSNLTYFNFDGSSPDPDIPGIGVDLIFGDNVSAPNVKYFSVSVEGTQMPYKGPVYAAIHLKASTAGTWSMLMPNHAQHMGIYSIKDAAQIENSVSQAFVLSQSLLLTAEMSDLNNGGVLSIARIPGRNPIGLDSSNVKPGAITANNWYEWISSLSNNNYDGPVKEGGYCFYLPEDETGFFYREVDNFFSSHLPYMVAEFTASDSTEAAIVRIKVTTIVQFTTTASIYDQRPSGYISDKDLLHQLLSVVPASYSNEGHKESIKKVLKVVGLKIKDLLKNPKTYTTAASIASKLAPALLAML